MGDGVVCCGGQLLGRFCCRFGGGGGGVGFTGRFFHGCLPIGCSVVSEEVRAASLLYGGEGTPHAGFPPAGMTEKETEVQGIVSWRVRAKSADCPETCTSHNPHPDVNTDHPMVDDRHKEQSTKK